MWDEVERKKPVTIAVGDDLKTMSIAELEARIAAFQGEIARCEGEIAAKQGSRDAAESVFGSPEKS